MLLSVVIPAYNEEENIGKTLAEVARVLREEAIPYELIVVNDNSRDGTQRVIEACMRGDPGVRLVNRRPPGGFGRAIRSGLTEVQGEVVVIFMADFSDDPRDLVQYYRKIQEGYDCVFGTRFSPQSTVSNYPKLKLFVNRLVNKLIQVLFWTDHNDMTNAFKAYRTEVIRECGPYTASHFNITIEMSLSAHIRKYTIAKIPINWHGRTWGMSNLRLRQMGRRYLSTLLKLFLEKTLIIDDVISERLAKHTQGSAAQAQQGERLEELEKRVAALERRLPP